MLRIRSDVTTRSRKEKEQNGQKTNFRYLFVCCQDIHSKREVLVDTSAENNKATGVTLEVSSLAQRISCSTQVGIL